jgi:hypothetical protein
VAAWLFRDLLALPDNGPTGYRPFGLPCDYCNHPLSRVVKDDRPPLRIDPERPWRIEFGRGSGWHGLETVKLDQDGWVVLHREKSGQWATTTLQLSADAVTGILEAVGANRLVELDRLYHADVFDGTQWVLCIRQGDREKTVYFDNHFPEPILRFATRLDEILVASADPNLRWRRVWGIDYRKHDRDLWDSIRR